MSIFSLSSRRLQQRKKGGKNKRKNKIGNHRCKVWFLLDRPMGLAAGKMVVGKWWKWLVFGFIFLAACSSPAKHGRRNGKLRFPLPVVSETDFSVICIGNECVQDLRIGIDWDGWREDAVRRLAGEMLEMDIWKVISKERLRLSSMGRDEKERAKARWRCKTQSKFSASNSPRRLIEILILGKVKISTPRFYFQQSPSTNNPFSIPSRVEELTRKQQQKITIFTIGLWANGCFRWMICGRLPHL